jgi:hypothetical protein
LATLKQGVIVAKEKALLMPRWLRIPIGKKSDMALFAMSARNGPPKYGPVKVVSDLIKVILVGPTNRKAIFGGDQRLWANSQNKNPQHFPAASLDGSGGLEFRTLPRWRFG